MRRRPRPRAGAAHLSAIGSLTAALLLAASAVPSAAGASPERSAESPSPTASADPDAEPDADADPAPATAPLRVVLTRLRPAVLPEDPREEVTVLGTVRNDAEEVWSDLNVYLLTSSRPLTSAAELAAAVDSDPTVEIGERIVEPQLFDDLPDLSPGETARFRLTVPRRAFEVSGEPGVYWLGVHVLGTPEAGDRDLAADGRARTFLPLVPAGTPGTELALAAQFRARVVRESDGRLALPEVLARRVAPGGRLHRLLALSRTAEQGTLSWVVDPAVVEAVASLAAGDPPYNAELTALSGLMGEPGSTADPGSDPETPPDDGEGAETGDDGAAEGDTGSETGGGDTGTDEGSEGGDATTAGGPAARRAARWLDDWAGEAERHMVLAVPYGDLDVAAAYSQAHAALSTYAFEVSDRVLRALDVRAGPVVAPPSGYLPANALTALPPDVLTVLAPEAVPTRPRPLVETSTGTTALLAGSAGSTRGPGPGAVRAALAVRQRLLAESALHALSADRSQPVLAVLPPWWDPGPRWRAAHLLDGLSQPWLELVDVAEVRRDARATELPLPDAFVYPQEQAEAELGTYVLDATADLILQGATYESVFVDVDSVGDRLGRQALLSSSFWSRTRPRLAADRARGAVALVETLLDDVTVNSPPIVTLSSEDGDFFVTLANGLGARIRVGLQTTVSGSGLQLTTPETITLEPNERRSVRVGVRSSGVGIHRVVLQPTTGTGQPVGDAAVLSVRSSSVGLVLWVIMAGGAVVLFTAIVVRIVRRVRRRRATHGPALRSRQRDGQRAGQRNGQRNGQPEGAA